MAPRLRPAVSYHDPIRPGIETVRVTQGRQVPPDIDQGLLEGILRLIHVAEDPLGDDEQAPGRTASQLLVGVSIALLRPFDQRSTHPNVLRIGAPWRRAPT